MTGHVFIAGHGRMKPNGRDITIPADVTLYWAVNERYNSTGTISYAALDGSFNQWSETKTAGEKYKEHYLCPDDPIVMCAKGQRFINGNHGPEYWLLQPRLDFITSLSAILTFLRRRIDGPLHVYWTCCRSPINEQSQGSVYLRNGSLIPPSKPGGVAAAPKADPKGGDIVKVRKTGDLVVLRKSLNEAQIPSFNVESLDGNSCIADIGGAVTFKNSGSQGLALPGTWPGKTVMGLEGTALVLAPQKDLKQTDTPEQKPAVPPPGGRRAAFMAALNQPAPTQGQTTRGRRGSISG